MTQAAALAAYGSNSPSNRNRIINGDMRIDQRNAGASVPVSTGSQPYSTDRWVTYNSSGDTQAFSQVNSSIPGFTKALRCTISNVIASGASSFLLFGQRIEGFNIGDLGWGTSSASAITVSFRALSSISGTFGGVIRNGSTNTRFYVFSFTLTANTPSTVTVTIPGDTTGVWTTDNTNSLELIVSMGCGTSFQGATGSWGSSSVLGATGQAQLNETAGATFEITGVQLEAGSVATPFEHVDYSEMLGRCQRYYMRWQPKVDGGATSYPLIGPGYASAAGAANYGIPTPSTLRATPTVSFGGTVSGAHGATAGALASVSNIYEPANNNLWIAVAFSTSPFTVGMGGILYLINSTANYFEVSAEL